MRPVSSAGVCLKAVSLGLEGLFGGKLPWCHADVLDVADLVALGEARILFKG